MASVTKMRDGSSVTDARLGRLVQFDERSRNYPVRALLTEEQQAHPRGYTWDCALRLDQGSNVPDWSDDSGCTGFSVTQEIAARPKVHTVDGNLAHMIYHRAKEIDEWEGTNYAGSSVLAAIKAATERAFYKEYRWAFSVMDLALAVGYHGPAVIGINWYESMFRLDSDDQLQVRGGIAGGHAILVNGVSSRLRLFRLHNSWGWNWGLRGEAYISWDNMMRLLAEDGEACVPVTRL